MRAPREIVPLEDAMAMLSSAELIHTFRSAGGILIGASWERKELFDHMDKFGVELSGPFASAMNHRLVVIDDLGPLFIETKEGF